MTSRSDAKAMPAISTSGLRCNTAVAVLLTALTIPLVLAAPASAQPKAPKLGGTYPSSPGVSTTPRLFGLVREVFISSVGGSRGLVTRDVEGEEAGQITVYATDDCSGAPVASGPSSELENSGIPVSVAPASTTTFSATNSDLTGTSICSNPIEYRQVSNPPAMPTVTGVNPASPADDNLPHVLGVADPESTVSLYTNSSCIGAPAATGTAQQFSAGGIQVAVADNSTTVFYARASWAELPSPCSSTTVAYQEVTVPAPGGGGGGPGGEGGGAGAGATGGSSVPPTPPELHTIPGGRSNNATPLVVGTAAGAARVQIFRNGACGGHPVASGSPAQLADGFPVQVAENATTRFYAEAIDAAGRVSDCSDPVAYVEDSTPPLTRITFGPGVKTRKRSAVFRFVDIADDAPGTTFLCKFDRRRWQQCQAPLKLPHLRRKAHTLRVKGIDAAGNEEAGMASRRFKVIREH